MPFHGEPGFGRMKLISSPENRIVKETASLSEKKYRERYNAFLVEGEKLVAEAVAQKRNIKAILVRTGAQDDILSFVHKAEADGIAVFELTGDVFMKVVRTESPQDIAAVVQLPEQDEQEFSAAAARGNILVLDRLQDPGNVGTLIRTAEAMGFAGIVAVKGTADPYQPKVVRAAAGSILRMPVLLLEDAESVLEFLAVSGRKIFATDACEGSLECADADISENSAVIIGNEGSGVSEELLAASECIRIPMEGQTESLNAAIAGSIIMYESKRQKGLKNKR